METPPWRDRVSVESGVKMEPFNIHVKNLFRWRGTAIYYSKHRINHRV